jgi:hypothetical protein
MTVLWDRTRRLLHHPAFRPLVCLAALIAFSWPLIARNPAGGWTCRGLYYYVYAAWGLVIGVLFLMSRGGGEDGGRSG